jgi:hypothetical protein
MNPEIVEKIKKLLRLGQSGNPHEAELALSRAFELAARHRIDMSALDLDEESERLVHEYFHIGHRVTFLRQRVLNIVVKFFNVQVCITHPRVVLVGTSADIAIAWYVYEFLVAECSRWLRVYQAREKAQRLRVTKNKRDNFIQGFVYGIAKQLDQSLNRLILEDSKFAIVLAEQEKAREARISELFPETKKFGRDLSRRNPDALMSGYERGLATKINRPIERSGHQLLLA